MKLTKLLWLVVISILASTPRAFIAARVARRVAKKHFAETASQVPKRVTVTASKNSQATGASAKDFVSSLVGIACGIAIAESIGPDFMIESAMEVRKKLLSPAGTYHESEFWRGPLC